MMQDPVCNMVLSETAKREKATYGGKEYYFCSPDCKDKFLKNPALFTEAAGQVFQCIACRNQTMEPLYRDGRGPYCCEKCYFRDTYLGEALEETESVFLSTIEAFVAAIDAREHEVGDHSYRVTQFAVIMAKEMRFAARELVEIYCGALLHDLGKIGIPDAILLKQGPLTDQEREVMSTHPEIGHRIISHIDYMSRAAEIVYAHHEQYDGSGYPRGLKEQQIPLGARVFAICDTLDALTVARPYRQALPFDEAKEYILSEAGKHFDPEIVAVFGRTAEQLKEYTAKIMM